MRKFLPLLALLLTTAPAPANLIVNGNFESGYTGFMTDHTIPPTNIVGGAGQYLLVINPGNHHPSAASYGDHTTGSGLMMMLNEYTVANKLVWGQTVAVVPGSDYYFSAFISSWVATAPSQLDVLFNGVSFGTVFAPATTGRWVEFTADWNSGAASSLTIALRNKTTADVGGDFALDDISLTGPAPAAAPVPEPSSLAVLLVTGGFLACARLRRRPALGASSARPDILPAA